ncbi:hypothetical protein EVAR_90636_1 [Eumeta japonica]|uniref:Uncharacterized protein n=1 Tax=Eumeta variegata TaxID=151549 RepID=A0A4C1ZWK1_EUMVA|nr:hypothetical protein EVAR_90636_1 [Eumeta japonica]
MPFRTFSRRTSSIVARRIFLRDGRSRWYDDYLLRGSSQYTILCLDVCDPCDSISAWIYRCDDTTRPGIARQRIISDKDDIADLQCFAATLLRDAPLRALFKSDSLKVPGAGAAAEPPRENDLALMIQVLLDLWLYVSGERASVMCQPVRVVPVGGEAGTLSLFGIHRLIISRYGSYPCYVIALSTLVYSFGAGVM